MSGARSSAATDTPSASVIFNHTAGIGARWLASHRAADIRFVNGDESSQEALANSLAVVLTVVRASLEVATADLDDLLTGWLAEDPEHWPIFRLMLLDAWPPAPGQWYDGTPPWVFVLVTKTAALQERGDLLIPHQGAG